MVSFVVPRIVREIALGQQPDVATSLRVEAIGVCRAPGVVENIAQSLADVQKVVGVDIVEESGADNLGNGVPEHQYCVVVDADDVPVLADTHVKGETCVVHSQREVEEGEVCGEFPEEEEAGLLSRGPSLCLRSVVLAFPHTICEIQERPRARRG